MHVLYVDVTLPLILAPDRRGTAIASKGTDERTGVGSQDMFFEGRFGREAIGAVRTGLCVGVPVGNRTVDGRFSRSLFGNLRRLWCLDGSKFSRRAFAAR